MGVVGIIPQIAGRFGVSISEAGLTVSVFALVVSLVAPVLPLLMAGINRRRMMLAALGLFTISNILAMTTDSFAVLLAARALPALLHPVYVAGPLRWPHRPRETLHRGAFPVCSSACRLEWCLACP